MAAYKLTVRSRGQATRERFASLPRRWPRWRRAWTSSRPTSGAAASARSRASSRRSSRSPCAARWPGPAAPRRRRRARRRLGRGVHRALAARARRARGRRDGLRRVAARPRRVGACGAWARGRQAWSGAGEHALQVGQRLAQVAAPVRPVVRPGAVVVPHVADAQRAQALVQAHVAAVQVALERASRAVRAGAATIERARPSVARAQLDECERPQPRGDRDREVRAPACRVGAALAPMRRPIRSRARPRTTRPRRTCPDGARRSSWRRSRPSTVRRRRARGAPRSSGRSRRSRG